MRLSVCILVLVLFGSSWAKKSSYWWLFPKFDEHSPDDQLESSSVPDSINESLPNHYSSREVKYSEPELKGSDADFEYDDEIPLQDDGEIEEISDNDEKSPETETEANEIEDSQDEDFPEEPKEEKIDDSLNSKELEEESRYSDGQQDNEEIAEFQEEENIANNSNSKEMDVDDESSSTDELKDNEEITEFQEENIANNSNSKESDVDDESSSIDELRGNEEIAEVQEEENMANSSNSKELEEENGNQDDTMDSENSAEVQEEENMANQSNSKEMDQVSSTQDETNDNESVQENENIDQSFISKDLEEEYSVLDVTKDSENNTDAQDNDTIDSILISKELEEEYNTNEENEDDEVKKNVVNAEDEEQTDDSTNSENVPKSPRNIEDVMSGEDDVSRYAGLENEEKQSSDNENLDWSVDKETGKDIDRENSKEKIESVPITDEEASGGNPTLEDLEKEDFNDDSGENKEKKILVEEELLISEDKDKNGNVSDESSEEQDDKKRNESQPKWDEEVDKEGSGDEEPERNHHKKFNNESEPNGDTKEDGKPESLSEKSSEESVTENDVIDTHEIEEKLRSVAESAVPVQVQDEDLQGSKASNEESVKSGSDKNQKLEVPSSRMSAKTGEPKKSENTDDDDPIFLEDDNDVNGGGGEISGENGSLKSFECNYQQLFSLSVDPTYVTEQPGKEVRLNCTLSPRNTSLPQIRMTWTVEKNNCSNTGTDSGCKSTLSTAIFEHNSTYIMPYIIQSLNQSDSGIYTCHAEIEGCRSSLDNATYTSQSIKVRIYIKPNYGIHIGVISAACVILLAILGLLFTYAKKIQAKSKSRYQALLSSVDIQYLPTKVLELPNSVYNATTTNTAGFIRMSASSFSSKSSFTSNDEEA